VALPWYILVGAETKASFLRGFLLTHNIGRYLSPMEHHSGPIYYYVVAVLCGFAPWSAFLGLAGWYSVAEWRRGSGPGTETARPDAVAPPLALSHAFLWWWITVYFLFFSLAGTKLPNYVLPLYPPVALLTARFLERWRRGAVHPAGA